MEIRAEELVLASSRRAPLVWLLLPAWLDLLVETTTPSMFRGSLPTQMAPSTQLTQRLVLVLMLMLVLRA